VLHAESNAIDFARESLEGTTIFCSLFPCSNCAARIVQAGIKTVVFEGEPREDLGARSRSRCSVRQTSRSSRRKK
jgi:deoxycytidylate deaminase